MNKRHFKQTKKNETPAEDIAPKDGNILRYSVLFIGLIVILATVNFLFQQKLGGLFIQRSWGMNDFSYFPVWAQLLFFALLVCAVIPSLNDRVIVWIEKLTGKIDSDTRVIKRRDKISYFLGISLLLTLLLYVFKIKYDFLGDRDTRVAQAVKGIYVHDEYLTMYLLHYLNNFMKNSFHFTPHRTFVFHSIISGFFYFFTGLLTGDLLFSKAKNQMLFFLGYISISTIMVFSGYVEIYAFPAVSVSIYLYSCFLYLKKKVPLIVPFLFLALAIGLHLEQLSLIPSFVFLAVSRYKFAAKLTSPVIICLAIISIPAIYVLYPILHMDPSTVVQLTPNPKYPGEYTLLSFTHFREFFNSQFLSSGIYLFLLPVILIVAYRKKLKLDVYSKFLLVAVLFSVVIVFTNNAMLGSADWDICSFPAISLSMFILYTFIKLSGKIYSPVKTGYILTFAIVFNTLNCWAWIGINSGKKSLVKIKDMMENEPGYFYNVYVPPELHLTAAYYSNHLMEEGNESVIKGYKMYGSVNSKAAYNYAILNLMQKDTLGAIKTLEKMVNDFSLAERDAGEELSLLYDEQHLYAKEFYLGQRVEDEYVRDPEKAITTLTKRYLGNIFSFEFRYASMQNDTANIQKSRRLIKMLIQ